MKPYFKYSGFIVLFIIFQSCNTLYNIRVIDIEVVEPAQILFPSGTKNIAVKYNNSNVSYNLNFAEYFEDSQIKTDSTNLDSIASEIYFESFFNYLNEQNIFDSITVLPKNYYSNVFFIDSLIKKTKTESDSIIPNYPETKKNEFNT